MAILHFRIMKKPRHTPHNTRAVVKLLLADRPLFHSSSKKNRNYTMGDAALRAISEYVKPHGMGMEIGSGYSTVILSTMAIRHTAVSLFREEHQKIQEWMKKQGLDTAKVTFVESDSVQYLSQIKSRPFLDYLLIDGNHAFPIPVLDWYYGADLLHPGGMLILDDVHLPGVRKLAEVLMADTVRWKMRHLASRTLFLERLCEDSVVHGLKWQKQPGAKFLVLREKLFALSYLWRKWTS